LIEYVSVTITELQFQDMYQNTLTRLPDPTHILV